MLKNIKCTIPITEERQSNKAVNQFIQSILEEDRRVKQLHAQEIQSTAENPRIKAENETLEICKELKQLKREKFLEEKRRQQLRENNEELRQLEIQIRAAYVSKALAEQKADCDRNKQQQLKLKRQEEESIQKERKKCMELQRAQEEKEHRKKEQLRGVLQEQMAETQSKRMQEYEEILKDKEEMQKVLRKIEAEQAQELADVMMRREEAKREMHEFLRSQELFKLQQRQQKVDDNEQFLEFMRQRDAEKKRCEDEKRFQLEQRQACSEKIGTQLYAIESERRKRENLLLDLLCEERKAKDDLRFRQNAEKQYMERVYAREELERYREDTRRLKTKMQTDEEDLFKQYQLRYFEEEEKLQQLADEKQRKKNEIHRVAMLELIKEQRQQRAANSTEVMQQHEILLHGERKRQEHIEKERIRLLKAQPLDVLRYLPTGVLRQCDRDILGLPTSRKKSASDKNTSTD